MVKSTKLILTLFTWSFCANAGFLSVSSGYDFFSTEQMNKNNSVALGPGFAIELGSNSKNLIASLFLKKSSVKGKVLHDDIKQELEHDITTIGFKAAFMVTRKTYGIIGYAVHKHRSQFVGVNEYQRDGLYKAYDLNDTQNSDGMFFGVGRNFSRSKSYSLYGEYLLNDISSGPKGKVHSAIVGIRFKVDLNI